MRGADAHQGQLFTFLQVEDRVPPTHPLRHVRSVALGVLEELSSKIDRLYAKTSRAAVPPEEILRAMLLWALYGVRSEMSLLEEMTYNLLYRWFVGLGIEEDVWPRSTFRNNKAKLMEAGIAGEFLARTLTQLSGRVLYHPYFRLDQALVEEWGGQLDLSKLGNLADD